MYLLGAVRNTELQKEFYPGWTCRFYVSQEVPARIIELLENNGAEVVVMENGAPYGEKMRWRFLATGEKDMDACIVRDADSRFGSRERQMGDEWLASGKPFHIIRDHPCHSKAMMGGTWGVRGGCVPDMEKLMKETREMYSDDQAFLLNEIYYGRIKENLEENVLIHGDFVAFPGETLVPTPPWPDGKGGEPAFVGSIHIHFPKAFYLKCGISAEQPMDGLFPLPVSAAAQKGKAFFRPLWRMLKPYLPASAQEKILNFRRTRSYKRFMLQAGKK